MIKLEKDVWVYIIILFAITYTVQIFVIMNGGEEYRLFELLIGITMFFPSIGAVWYLLKTKTGIKFINWKIEKPIYIIISLILPILVTLFGILIIEKLGFGINHAYSSNNNAIENIEIPLLLGTNTQSIPYFILNFATTGIVFSIVTGLLTLGEEIGWRGFLQKKLLERNNLFRSLTFLGLLWGFWHFPLIVNGFNYPEYPIWGALLIFPLMTIFISFFLGFLTINSNSIWPAVLTHGAINSIMIFLFEVDFGENKFLGNFLILAIWILVGTISYQFIKQEKITNTHNA